MQSRWSDKILAPKATGDATCKTSLISTAALRNPSDQHAIQSALSSSYTHGRTDRVFQNKYFASKHRLPLPRSHLSSTTLQASAKMSAYTSASWSPLLLLLLCTALSYATASPPTSTTFNHTFDFVIVGGGTAGLVLANRLSANVSVRVAVIEAGGSVQGDPRVLNTRSFGLGLGTELDWAYATLPQRFARNETQTCHAGRALGGTSTINGKCCSPRTGPAPEQV